MRRGPKTWTSKLVVRVVSEFVRLSTTALLPCGCGSRTALDVPMAIEPAPLSGCAVTSDALVVLSQNDGTLARPKTVRTVSGGQSVRVGTKIVWSFAEAFLTKPAAGGDLLRTSIGATSDAATPFDLSYALDGSGAPYELIALTDAERVYNKEHGPDETLVVWPMGMVSTNDGAALVYYAKILVRPGLLNLQPVCAGVARIVPGETSARRDTIPLFVAPEPQFGPGAVVVDDYVYVYACSGGHAPDGGCRVSRAPLDRAREPSAYAVWNGAAWSDDIGSSVVVFDWVPGGASVVWHPHLGRFVASYAEPFSDRVVARTAPRPEGPWTTPVTLFHTLGSGDYVGQELGALSSDCGRDTFVLYYHPRGPIDGELHAVHLRLE